jgi:deazaflavin-dependent oxidoreductase (nitroreductase family)
MTDINIPDSLPRWIKDHIELYLADGEAGHLWDSAAGGGKGLLPTLLLTTVGRKSGNRLAIPLIYQPTGDGGYCIIASKGGAPAHPAWYLNLSASNTVELKVANDKFTAVARVAEGDERERLWKLMADYYSPYNAYQAATERQIPVVVLDPKP